MQIGFLLGPAGSGKTFRCLQEIRDALRRSPDGAPLLLLAPKQATFQLERQLLSADSLSGYTRLRIVSFERLARFVFEQLGQPAPNVLDEEGRVMVLRGLLAKNRQNLKLFRASARLAGFASQLSLVLRELQQHRLSPAKLRELAEEVGEIRGLSFKLQDLATLLDDYLDWLKSHRLLDAGCLLDAAAEALQKNAEWRFTRELNRSEQRERREDRSDDPRPTSSRANRRAPEQLSLLEPSIRAPFPLFSPVQSGSPSGDRLQIEQLWMDGFAELSPQELDFLAAVVPFCLRATLAFCLDDEPDSNTSWLSHWSLVGKAFNECRGRIEALPGAQLTIELLRRDSASSRFADNPALAHLERNWGTPKPFSPAISPLPSDGRGAGGEGKDFDPDATPQTGDQSGAGFHPAPTCRMPVPPSLRPESPSIRIVACANPESEATFAAREILRHVRSGRRFRDVSVLVRNLEGYHAPLQRVFSRYEIPFFLDRREIVSHHPLAELTRSALRAVAFQWAHDDWFAALKTGLVPVDEVQLDRLENEALARGWKGAIWRQPLQIPDDPELAMRLECLRQKIIPPFSTLADSLGKKPNQVTGPKLAEALREFWSGLNVENQLEDWVAWDAENAGTQTSASVHATVWDQMNSWLDNVELAFPNEPIPLRDWLPILEAGLANLTVGVIPPALDQVLVGAIDRSRNPDIKLAFLLGLNDRVFPAVSDPPPLLTDADRTELEKRNVVLSSNRRRQLGRERYYAYIACTRPRERLIATYSAFDADDKPLSPSPFVAHLQQLFPALEIETAPRAPDLRESVHACELIVPLIENSLATAKTAGLDALRELPALAPVFDQLQHFETLSPDEQISLDRIQKLYGQVLHTSVSRLEQFAACPFRFFVHSGLRAEERKLFELDVREQGSFQHDVLQAFHQQLASEGKRWRDVTPQEARERVAEIARQLAANYRDGLLQADEANRFKARVLSESLQNFVETLVRWMREQYQFDPVAVEVPFGASASAPAWTLGLQNGNQIALHGRIDRVDICRETVQQNGGAYCVVVDYKSSQKQLDPLLVANGVQLQLLAYLNVLRHWPKPNSLFGVDQLIPAGVFYVNLRGQFDSQTNRSDALAQADENRRLAYRHCGRFDARALRRLDSREDVNKGDQFNYRLKKDGSVHKACREIVSPEEFTVLLDSVEKNLRNLGERIFSGEAGVAPYRKGSATACDHCDYRAICRIDPWTHQFRVLEGSKR